MRRLAVIVAAAGLVFSPAVAAQARPAAAHGHPASARSTGNDISWPQCGTSYPSGQAFGIVGVNGGKASDFNSCFPSEWTWAQNSTGSTSQPKAQPYVNTGNPGDVLAQYDVTDWPSSSVSADPYGTCTGTWTDDTACSWQYGYDRATDDMSRAGGWKGAWWLDIETANSWTSSTAKNQATLEGMVYAFEQAGDTVGIYSSSGSWSSLFGTVASTSTLYSLPEWRPGARTLAKAQSNCSLAPFEGDGKVEITQYVANNLDYDYSCIG